MSGVSSYGSWLPPAAPPEGPSPAVAGTPRWEPWTAWAALLSAFAFAIVGAIVIGLVGELFGASFVDAPPAVNIAATIAQEGAFVAGALLFAARAGRILPAQFGFRPVRIGTALRWMAIAYVGFLTLSFVWAQALKVSQKDELPDSLGANRSTAALVAVCVVVTVLAPLAEETLFRGYFFGALRNWRGPWPAALLTGAVFGAIHGFSAPAVFLVPLAVLGVALCVVRWRTGSLLPCIALHAINNSIAFGSMESWTVGQTLLLGVGAVGVTLLAARVASGAHAARA
jgi:uncharacterized protein